MKHNRTGLISIISFLLLTMTGKVAFADFHEGIEYKRVSPAQPTSTREKIEVVELFWYGCPHCYHLEPKLTKWLASKPENVVFVRIPAVFNPKWELHARMYYTAEALGMVDKMHTPLFDELHKEKRKLDSVAQIQAFFAKFGVSAEDFNNTFNSFVVVSKTNRAKQLSKSYQIEGVPSLLVNGKFRTDGPLANGQDGMLKVVDYLIGKESAGK